ncbi:MAG: ABC-2 type transport system ATP-binding protein [Candidatus Paceibacteria bacterium]|jgi:ABC-2 type transport system ATP-binding protein
MIHVKGLSKTFHVHEKAPGLAASVRSLFHRKRIAKHAVQDVSFDIGPGEIVGLVGANGAGKTTLVKMLAGIIHPTSGEARVLGHEPWKRSNALRHQIALIMGQKASLWWDLPAADCFLLLKEIYRIPDDLYRERLGYLTETLGISGELHTQIRRLSLGERMKMELVSTLLHAPKVVYLDEPTIGLDLTAQRAIREFLLRYREEHNPAMILTSHYMEDIEQLCKRILLIQDGRLVFDGELDEVMRRYSPHKILTARFKPGAASGSVQKENLPGEVLELDSDHVRLKVDRETVTSSAQRLLSCFPVADISIEEVEVGTVIEQIFREGTLRV